MKRKKLGIRIAVLAVIAVAAIVFGPLLWYNRNYLSIPPVTAEQLDELSLDGFDNLMIVAHPDDEFIWGGAHLLSDKWLVVVITNGDNQKRNPEFEEMMRQTGDKGLILSYPDKVGGKRSNWEFWSDSICADLKTILTYKTWDRIVTHNQGGEYGHQHHKSTHQLVVKTYDVLFGKPASGDTSKLWFFGTYYRNVELPDTVPSISDELLAKKESLAPIYESQSNTVDKFRHMFPHEDFIPYDGTN
ncbi:MAG: PIG-L family deacetylase [Lachnospiraceae bacterium]|nr:PIG-L family deacetylase [Lachnospiraceae bacterium]